jgi:thiol-disulfide isomerase/thioredoxin
LTSAAIFVALAAIVGPQLLFCESANAAELQRFGGASPVTFTLPTPSGGEVALESRRGSVVLVHFFATWCEPCLTELPALNRLAQRGDGKIKVLAVSVAEPGARVRRFFQATPVDFPVLLDRERAVAKAWNVSTLPTTIVLDAGLQPRLTVGADFNWDSVDPDKFAGALAQERVRAERPSIIETPTTLHSGG